jgi:hypothetical protein
MLIKIYIKACNIGILGHDKTTKNSKYKWALKGFLNNCKRAIVNGGKKESGLDVIPFRYVDEFTTLASNILYFLLFYFDDYLIVALLFRETFCKWKIDGTNFESLSMLDKNIINRWPQFKCILHIC